MTRKEEYFTLCSELEQTPKALEGVVERALKRKNTFRKKRMLFGVPAASLAACLTGFILLVNLVPTFASACGRVTVLRELAKAVAWSPSLSAAVENAYVQPVGQSRTENGVTATVEYLIVDQKQLNIFYTLTAEDPGACPQLEADGSVELPGGGDGYCLSSNSYGVPNGELRSVQLDFVNREMPAALNLTLRVYAGQAPDTPPESAPPEEADLYGYLLSGFPEGPEREKTLAELTFSLIFDPGFTARGEVLAVNRAFTLDGQTVTLTAAEVYPTHLRLSFAGSPDNTAWLRGLNFYLENENGERFSPAANGISASAEPEGKGMGSFWVDSPWFSRGTHLTLHIAGAAWLEKDRERVRIDLEAGTLENGPTGMRVEWTERRETGWLVCTSAPYRWGNKTMYATWSGDWYDGEGNGHPIGSCSASGSLPPRETLSGEISGTLDSPGRYYEVFGLEGCSGGEAWLSPDWTAVTALDTPVSIPIK